MKKVCNIAAYQFAALDDLKARRLKLMELCRSATLKGTILLSTEGINLFVAGAPESITLLLSELRAWPGLENLPVKESESDHQPFNRMLVRIKKEIIAFGVPGIDPAQNPSPKLAAKELKRWLDEGRPITLLDTRNDYEVKLGTFRNAKPIGVDNFRDFPAAVGRLPESMKDQPIVMFCTGGIRCEKAGPFMQREGFKNIFQLDGGILKYFEECGSAHYDGECFVFDQRVGVDPSLRETESGQCFHCLVPLTKEEMADSRYVPPRSCPYCFKTPAEELASILARRQADLRQATEPLPGSVPYDNYRPLVVPERCAGMTVLEFLETLLSHVSRVEWDGLFEKGLVVGSDKAPVTKDHRVRPGEWYFNKQPASVEPAVNAGIEILYEDEALVVLNKPAPLPMHPSGRFNRNTLQHILGLVYHPQKPRPAHRLDANTTGITLLTRTRHFASILQPQFARGEVKKTYLVRVHGHPVSDTFSCDAPISDEPGEAGSRQVDIIDGLAARTEFSVIRRDADGTALLEARPLTGRTNQIRIHLWQLGHSLCGDAMYLADGKIGGVQTLGLEAPCLCLHAWKVGFTHPMNRQWVEFTAPPPEWAK
ncbi:MAG TPA: RluA family pseudouridine synthase [Candidatus Limnocylindria bacterium]|jgi:RluA family pseudouridine synthase|nr:RluA family pseudouridine synthase [Candidatus Limnocylindria bacterium]